MMRMNTPKYLDAGETMVKTRTKHSPNLILACCSSYLAALSFGYMIGYSSPALPQMQSKGGPMDDESASWFGSVVTVGGIIGCPLAGWLVQRAGRKGTLLCMVIPYILGWGMIMVSSDVGLLCLGRVLTGIGSGMAIVCCPMFIAEVSTKELRGMLGSGVQLSITVGILLAYGLGMMVGWRSLAFIGLCIPVTAAVLTLKVYDTPQFLLMRGSKQEALQALTWLRGPQADVVDECRDLEESLDTQSEKLPWAEFCKPHLYKPLKVSVALMIFQQLSGINVVMFYTVSIFESAGFKDSSNLATVGIGIVQVLGTLAACMLMDRAGRRPLLLVGGFGMAVTCFTMGLYYYISGEAGTESNNLSWLSLLSLIGYIIAFALAWGPIPMLVMSEIFPLKARGSASAIASLVNWTFAFIVTKEFDTLKLYCGQHGAFWFYGSCCCLALGFVWKFVPETKGKSLEDIELYFVGH